MEHAFQAAVFRGIQRALQFEMGRHTVETAAARVQFPGEYHAGPSWLGAAFQKAVGEGEQAAAEGAGEMVQRYRVGGLIAGEGHGHDAVAQFEL